MKGHKIVVTTPSHNRERELIVPTGETWYPGQVVQVDPTVALKHGRHTGKIYNRAADGDKPLGSHWLVTERNLALKGDGIASATSFGSYAAGEQASVYAPSNGEQFNLLWKNVTGTGDDLTAGVLLIIDDDTGKFIATTGTPATEVAVSLEAIVDPIADTLFWAEWTGY